MNNNLMYWLRWVCLLPGAVLSGLLATFPLHWILYFSLKNGEMISGVDIRPIEYTLYPAVIAFVFIIAGYMIAPRHRLKVAVVFFVIYVVAWLLLILLFTKGANINESFSLRTILSLVGAGLGLFSARMIEKNSSGLGGSL